MIVKVHMSVSIKHVPNDVVSMDYLYIWADYAMLEVIEILKLLSTSSPLPSCTDG